MESLTTENEHTTNEQLARYKAELETQIAGLRAEFECLGDYRLEELQDAEKSLKKLNFLLLVRRWRSNSDAVSREEIIGALPEIENAASIAIFGDSDRYGY